MNICPEGQHEFTLKPSDPQHVTDDEIEYCADHCPDCNEECNGPTCDKYISDDIAIIEDGWLRFCSERCRDNYGEAADVRKYAELNA